LPDEPWQTKYPPVFPLALSVLWRVDPDFPANLPLFSAFSIFSTLIFLTLTAAYLLKRSYARPLQIFLVLLFTALNWRMVILATSILTEAFFATLTVCVLWLASSLGEDRTATKLPALGVFLALAALTRLAGISLLAAVLFFAFKRRQIRRFLFPVIFASAMIAGWFLWCHLHRPIAMNSHVAYYTNYFQDWRSLLQSNEPAVQHSLIVPILMMVGKNVVTMLAYIPIVCLGVQIDWFSRITEGWQFWTILIGFFSLILLVIGFWRTRSAGKGLLHAFILAYLGLLLLWPYMIYDRFLIPILPFILFFIMSGGTYLLHSCFKSHPAHFAAINGAGLIFALFILASLLITAGFGIASGLRDQLIDSKKAYAPLAQQNQELVAWLKTHSRADDVLTCYQDPVYFLYAGIKAIRLPDPNENKSVMSYSDRLQRFIKDNKVSLLLQNQNDFSLESYSARKRALLAHTLDSKPLYFVSVFSTRIPKSIVYRIAPGTGSDAK
jgi:hypothetical protein